MSGPDKPIQADNRTEVRRWLAIVEEDIDVAIAAEGLSRLGASAYHVQKAAVEEFRLSERAERDLIEIYD